MKSFIVQGAMAARWLLVREKLDSLTKEESFSPNMQNTDSAASSSKRPTIVSTDLTSALAPQHHCVCEVHFLSEELLRQHYRDVHKTEPPTTLLPCPECHSTFTHRGPLFKHMESEHYEDIKFRERCVSIYPIQGFRFDAVIAEEERAVLASGSSSSSMENYSPVLWEEYEERYKRQQHGDHTTQSDSHRPRVGLQTVPVPSHLQLRVPYEDLP